MLTTLRLILSLTGQRAGLFGAHAQARAKHIGLLTAFGVAALIFALVLVTVALAGWLGTVPALAIMTGAMVAGGVGVTLSMRAERRAHLAAVRRQNVDDRRIVQAALLTALPAIRRGGWIAAGAAVVALLLLSGGSRKHDDDD